MTRVLADHDELHTPVGHASVGWAVVEDLLTVLILILRPAVSPGGLERSASLPLSLAIALGKMAALMMVLFLVGTRVIPWLLKKVAATRSRELFTLTILSVALGIAFGSSRLFGVSMALGAFLAGMVVGRSDFSLRAASPGSLWRSRRALSGAARGKPRAAAPGSRFKRGERGQAAATFFFFLPEVFESAEGRTNAVACLGW